MFVMVLHHTDSELDTFCLRSWFHCCWVYVEKTSEACCYETVTDAVEQQAKVKMPLSLPEICIGNHKSMA